MKNYGKLQEAPCARRAKCWTLGLTVGVAILAIVASPAHGQTVHWGPSVQLDDGFAPRMAASGTTVVQVHQATNGSGPLWYRTAQLGPNGTIQWFGSGSLEYDNGSAPSVAASGTTAVEVHQGDAGSIWYRSGQIQLDGTIKWSGSIQMDDGFVASHPAWERQARPQWKYIKAILAHSGLTRDKIRPNRRARAAPEQAPAAGAYIA